MSTDSPGHRLRGPVDPKASMDTSLRKGPWLSASQREELALAFVLTVCVGLFPRWRVFEQLWVQDHFGLNALPWPWYHDLLFVVAGLVLTLSAPRRSGLRFGAIRERWKRVLLVCGGSVLAVAVVYPRLPVRPFSEASASMWAVSPLAQELLFMGYLYGRLDRAFPGFVHPKVPLARALVITCAFFGFWHLPNFFGLPAGYVLFQLFYTGVLGLIPGLSRQWTGSIVYVVLTHSAVNYIAWAVS